MGKLFYTTIIGLIIATIVFSILWILIPFISSILNLKPFYVSIFICGFIVLVSLLGIRFFKDIYIKFVPTIIALFLGLTTVGVMWKRYYYNSYQDGVLINQEKVYNSFGIEILDYNEYNEVLIISTEEEATEFSEEDYETDEDDYEIVID